jgi:hypothetical protein
MAAVFAVAPNDPEYEDDTSGRIRIGYVSKENQQDLINEILRAQIAGEDNSHVVVDP